jgi:hypothetical protein
MHDNLRKYEFHISQRSRVYYHHHDHHHISLYDDDYNDGNGDGDPNCIYIGISGCNYKSCGESK